jgi:hypothetical protein
VASASAFYPLQTDQADHDDRVNGPVGDSEAEQLICREAVCAFASQIDAEAPPKDGRSRTWWTVIRIRLSSLF